MKITPLLASLASLASLVLLANAQDAQAPLLQKQVVVTYPSSTPKSIIDDAISRISAEGGEILHKFSLFKGFIAKTTAQVLEGLETLSVEHKPTIEDDGLVSINV